MERKRAMAIGAEPREDGFVDVRVWAPRCQRVEVALPNDPASSAMALENEGGGYFAGRVQARVGDHYGFRLDGRSQVYPDPASRSQPDGPHGASQIIDPAQFVWRDSDWPGIDAEPHIVYEMHIGTFTFRGTWNAAAEELPELASLGITVLEVMPVAEFPGRFGWGYDGVCLFAPTRLYGTPDDFRAFVNQAHGLGMAVILDVVYNHFGPDGNYLKEFAPAYFTDRYKNEWGEAINFDGPDANPVREYFKANAAYWIREFHLDGLRLDATQQIFDGSQDHILTAIGREVRAGAGGRRTWIVAENELQETKLVRAENAGGYGLDAVWNDDFHHSATVALTGKNPAYYSDYLGRPQEFISAAKWGYLYQGQRYSWQKQRRGSPGFDLAPGRFVNFLQNHDQVANSSTGLRCHLSTSPGRYKAMTALMMLAPGTPMLFQGQEFAASAPFHFFADHNPDLARLVARGRAEFLAQFPSLALPASQATLRDPGDPRTFEACRLDFHERQLHAPLYALHKDLIALRRNDPVFRASRRGGLDGAVLGEAAFVLRFFAHDGADRLLIINLGCDLHFAPAPEPLLGLPHDQRWAVLWSSEEHRYLGTGTPPLDTDDNWRIPGEAAVVLFPAPVEAHLSS